MREALFSSILASEGPLDGRRFLDLYAGSAAVGLEAWSRGAAHVLAVESDQRAARTARSNVAAAGALGAVVVRQSAVERVLEEVVDGAYDLVFADPPYQLELERVHSALTSAHDHGWLRAASLVVLERSSRDPALTWPPFIDAVRDRPYGEGTLWYGRVDPPTA